MKNRRSVYIKSFLKRLKASGVLVPVLFFAVLLAAAVIIGVAVSKGSSGGKLVVCLDPGHGGEDFGTVDSSDERWEKVDNLEFALLVKEKLCEGGAEVIMTREQVLDSLDEVIHMLGTHDITTVRASMGMYLLCRWISKNTDIRVLLTGEISDELFGYKYTDFAPSPEEFQRESEKRVRELHMYDVLRADRCISANSLEARVPFGDLDFVRYVLSVDPAKKMNVYGKGK